MCIHRVCWLQDSSSQTVPSTAVATGASLIFCNLSSHRSPSVALQGPTVSTQTPQFLRVSLASPHIFNPKPVDFSLQLTQWLIVLFLVADYFVSGTDWVPQTECIFPHEWFLHLCHFNLPWEERPAPPVMLFHISHQILLLRGSKHVNV